MALFLGVGADAAGAQDASIPKRAYAVGLNSTAGFFGVEWVARSLPAAKRLGAAAGLGIFGGGVRLNLSLREPTAHNRVPYLASGLSVIAWLPPGISGPRSVASIEAGVQLWPKSPRRLYVDLGVGAGFEMGSSGDALPAVRVVAGRTF